jgi:imidazole glycerol phosphate synthase glutamine amidotransferase subunit
LPFRIGILDLGAANQTSVRYALERAGGSVYSARSSDDISRAKALVVPGVANVGYVLNQLDARGLREPLRDSIACGVPTLAICAGFQLLFEGSEEAPDARGLGFFPGIVKRLNGERRQHVGWNRVIAPSDGQMVETGWAYFSHGFAAQPASLDTCAQTTYGSAFASAAQNGNVLGVQFHPERSGAYGAALLARFVAFAGEYYAR